jgi:adenosyl cobinamide kinase/adenosyl cobinamide phosphate guanylyltransferase
MPQNLGSSEVLTLLIGGVRSGKSSLAVELGRRHEGPVTFIATCEPFDDDLAARVARHRAERPAWPTLEAPLELTGALTEAGASMAIVDCLTLWIANLLETGAEDGEILSRSGDAAATAAGRGAPTVVVTNEVGLGVHPETAVGRRYRDLLGTVNQQWARRAERTLWLVAGRAVPLADPWAVLP